MRKLFLAPALLALVLAVLVAPNSQGSLGEAHATTVVDLATAPADVLTTPPSVAAWPVPNARTYRILSSCSPYASAIRTGARAWANLTESSSGTPVECRNGYITDCGGGSRVVGCNWGAGQRIALYMGGVNDDALLAAHEFGHNWYGHSSYQCAGWGSAAQVMAPSICNYSGATTID
ncbi:MULTISPECIES: hypothetical protein [Saccharothrix]|uniref:hypothetical protein n=1 Tax=Saccharothrix TaxID=2071 RepID=UPI00093ED0B2|nr:hypothetical protein [Saccharothrix sp. CB00851]OKI32486.1 hypothetical protein A6A25_25530 [Saccharothrix sp. CB00851]